MKLSSKGRYAVMALTDLAKFNPKDPVTLRDISLRQGISLVYLEQLFLKLKKNKIVKSIRGNKGGYVLNKKASEVKISEILLAVDEKIITVGCKKNSKQGCNGRLSKCITHNFWEELEDYINDFFKNKKLEDLINQTKFN
jgi:Rrf2 family iron-sulfur cluster assembly transcriptional regulator